MSAVCLCFEVHLASRLLPCDSLAALDEMDFDDHAASAKLLDRMAAACYLPANRLLGEEIAASGGRFRIALSVSGPLISQMERHRPDLLRSFQELCVGGGVELLAAPWHRSLSFLHSNREFDRQVDLQLEALEKRFQIRPRVFHNAELIYNDSIAAKAETMGFDGVLADFGATPPDGVAAGYLYRAPETARIKTLARHGGFSAELGCRAGAGAYPEAADFAGRIAASGSGLTVVFLRYEALAGIDGADPGKLRFWQSLPQAADDAGLQWVTPSEAVDLYDAIHPYPCAKLTGWTDPDGLSSPWEGNPTQIAAMERIHRMEKAIHAARDAGLLDAWAGLQAVQHFHWMAERPAPAIECTEDANPYGSPAEARDRLMAALDCLESRLGASFQVV